MKICPNCRQTYTDDNLNFCLNDGSYLTPYESNEQKTVLMDEPRITNQTNWDQQNYQPPVWQNQPNLQTQQANFPMQMTSSPNQTLPTISLVLGILSIVTVCCWGGIPFGAAAIVTGVIAMNKEKSNPQLYGGRGLSLGGIITGGIALLLGFGFLLIAIIGNIR